MAAQPVPPMQCCNKCNLSASHVNQVRAATERAIASIQVCTIVAFTLSSLLCWLYIMVINISMYFKYQLIYNLYQIQYIWQACERPLPSKQARFKLYGGAAHMLKKFGYAAYNDRHPLPVYITNPIKTAFPDE